MVTALSMALSPGLFMTLVLLLGAVMLAASSTRDWPLLALALLLPAGAVLRSPQDAAIFNLYYPACFGAACGGVLLATRGAARKGMVMLVAVVATAAAYAAFNLYVEARFGLVTASVAEAKHQAETFWRGLGSSMAEADIKEMSAMMSSLLDTYYPALGFMPFLAATACNLYLVRFLVPGVPVPLGEPLVRLDLPFWGLWGVIAGIAAYLFLDGRSQMLGLNVLVVSLGTYFFQGLAVTTLLFRSSGIPPFVAGFIYLFLLLSQAFWLVLAMTGVMDACFNLKKFFMTKEA